MIKLFVFKLSYSTNFTTFQTFQRKSQIFEDAVINYDARWRPTWRVVHDPAVWDVVTDRGVLLGRWGLDADNLKVRSVKQS